MYAYTSRKSRKNQLFQKFLCEIALLDLEFLPPIFPHRIEKMRDEDARQDNDCGDGPQRDMDRFLHEKILA